MAILDYGDDIYRDTNVLPPNVYIGSGQGCGTIWLSSVKQARKVIEKRGYNVSGRDAGLCEQCSCHYSFGTPEFVKFPEYACQEWKEQLVEALSQK